MASSSEAMRILELYELQAQEGPCLDCYRTGAPVLNAELALACYFTFVNLYALTYGLIGTLPFIAIFQWGFLYTSGMSLAQSLDWLVPREQEA